jgi:hypothetical protein
MTGSFTPKIFDNFVENLINSLLLTAIFASFSNILTHTCSARINRGAQKAI